MSLLPLIFGTLLFSWPALLNHGPFFFPDTSSYIRGADAAVVIVTGHRSIWSDRLLEDVVDPATSRDANAAPAPEDSMSIRPTRPVLLNRSIYYGALLFAGLSLLGGIGTVIAVAAVSAGTVLTILSALTPELDGRRRRTAILILSILGLLTPLPFFVSRLMPDVFSGLMVASLAALYLFWADYSRLGRLWLIAIVLGSVTFHATHVLLAVATALLCLAIAPPARRSWLRSAALFAAPIAVVAVAHVSFVAAVEQRLGQSPIKPPFISARLIEDGPGYLYLGGNCPDSGWALCRYLSRMPHGSDEMLWSDDPTVGIFMAAAPQDQRRIGSEDFGFALAVLRDRPTDVLWSSAQAIWRQFGAVELEHFNYSPADLANYQRSLPPAVGDALVKSRGGQGTMPIGPTLAATLVSVALAALVFVATATGVVRGDGSGRFPTAVRYALVLVGVFLINIAICGVMSTPHGRYMMRLIWLIPFGAAVILATARPTRQRPV